jgi:transposase
MAKSKDKSKTVRNTSKTLKNLPKTKELQKASTVALLELGYSHRKVAKMVGVSAVTVNNWKKLYNAGNMRELTTDLVENIKPKLLEQDLELIKLTHKGLKKTLKDKETKHKLSDLTNTYKVLRDGIVPPTNNNSGSGNAVNIQINNEKENFSLDLSE